RSEPLGRPFLPQASRWSPRCEFRDTEPRALIAATVCRRTPHLLAVLDPCDRTDSKLPPPVFLARVLEAHTAPPGPGRARASRAPRTLQRPCCSATQGALARHSEAAQSDARNAQIPHHWP